MQKHTETSFVWTVRQPDSSAAASPSALNSSHSSSVAAGEPALGTPPSQLQRLPHGTPVGGISTAAECRNISAGQANQTGNTSRARSSRQPVETSARRSADDSRKKTDDKCCIS